MYDAISLARKRAALALLLVIALSVFYYRRKKQQIIEKEEELEALRQLVSESQVNTEQKDDRFFKRIVLQQLGVIRMAASNPTTANQELLKRMKEFHQPGSQCRCPPELERPISDNGLYL